jgi:hypothetical protein
MPSPSSPSQSKKIGGRNNKRQSHSPRASKNQKSSSSSTTATTATTTTRDVANDEKINNQVPSVLTLMSLPVPVRVTIFNMLGQQTQEELTDLTLVSKQVYEDCKRPGIEWKIIPTIEIRPRQQQGDDMIRGRVFMRNLTRHLQNNETNEKLPCYLHVRMQNIHKFNAEYIGQNDDELFEIAKSIQLDGVLSLDISSLSARTIHFTNSFPLALSNILPNLLEINISNLDLYCGSLSKISRNCPFLEKVMWNNVNEASHVYLNGHGMHLCNNLK